MFKININRYTSKESIEKFDKRLRRYDCIREIEKVEYEYNSNSKRYIYTDSDHILIYLDEQNYIAECILGKNIKEEIREIDLPVRYTFKKRD